eukprot:829891-Amorphochlora_amoeboformis.AAC.1
MSLSSISATFSKYVQITITDTATFTRVVSRASPQERRPDPPYTCTIAFSSSKTFAPEPGGNLVPPPLWF